MEHTENIPPRGYQKMDPHIDYNVYKVKLGKYEQWFRGPEPTTDNFISCIGAAQTWGRLCEKSYPQLFTELSGTESLNISLGGFDLRSVHLNPMLDKINSSKFCVLQIMSGRCQHIPSRGIIKATNKYHFSDGSKQPAWKYWSEQFKSMNTVECEQAFQELNHLYVNSYEKIISKIKVPIILLYVGSRKPHEDDFYKSKKISYQFPHWVSAKSVDLIKRMCGYYIEEIYDYTLNNYYPTQSTYESIASKLFAKSKEWSLI
jgi:hypothetical protein